MRKTSIKSQLSWHRHGNGLNLYTQAVVAITYKNIFLVNKNKYFCNKNTVILVL